MKPVNRVRLMEAIAEAQKMREIANTLIFQANLDKADIVSKIRASRDEIRRSDSKISISTGSPNPRLITQRSAGLITMERSNDKKVTKSAGLYLAEVPQRLSQMFTWTVSSDTDKSAERTIEENGRNVIDNTAH